MDKYKTVYLKVVGIICPESDSSMMSGVGYTKALTEYVINKASEYDIILLDLVMPNKDGMYVLEELNKRGIKKVCDFYNQNNKGN